MSKGPNITPLGKRVLVKPADIEEKTAGGLILPPSASEDQKAETGEVIKLGTGEKDFDFSVKVGDMVFFKKYSPQEMEVDGEKYLLLEQEDILAVIG